MIIVIDAGHGWETEGKNSNFHKIGNEFVLKENNVNEAICNKLSVLNEDIIFITNEHYDVSLEERVKRANLTNADLFISIHADAYNEKDKASGGTIFYNSDKGKYFADIFTKKLQLYEYDIKMRQPKQANFYVIKETKMPAILIELGFMTTKNDLNFLINEVFRNKTAKILNRIINEL